MLCSGTAFTLSVLSFPKRSQTVVRFLAVGLNLPQYTAIIARYPSDCKVVTEWCRGR